MVTGQMWHVANARQYSAVPATGKLQPADQHDSKGATTRQTRRPLLTSPASAPRACSSCPFVCPSWIPLIASQANSLARRPFTRYALLTCRPTRPSPRSPAPYQPHHRCPYPGFPQLFPIFPKCCYPRHPKSAESTGKQAQIALYVLLPSCYPAATYLLPGCYPTATLATVVAALCQSPPMLLRAPHVIGSLWWRLSSSVVQPQANCAGLALRQPRSTSPAQ